MTTKEILQAARDLISDPKKWTVGKLETFNGSVCAIGAINRALGLVNSESESFIRPENARAIAALAAVIDPTVEPAKAVWNYNDSMPHHCVIEAFDAAIEKQP